MEICCHFQAGFKAVNIIIKQNAMTVLSAVIFAISAGQSFAEGNARSFSPVVGEVVNVTKALADGADYQGALEKLDALIKTPDPSPYERGVIYQMMGQYSYELDQLDASIKAFENALTSGGLLPEERDNIDIVIAQLMIGKGQYRGGAERLESKIAMIDPIKSQYVDLLVNAWVQAEDYARALPWAEKWFAAANPKTRRHYDLMNFLYVQLGMDDAQIEIIQDMVERWPEDKTLWESWASVLANMGQEKEAFEVFKMMYQAGLIETEADILKLVQYHDFYDLPLQGAEILEREIETGLVQASPDNLQRTAALFGRARVPERGFPYLERAAESSSDPEIKIDFANRLFAEGQCERAGKLLSEMKSNKSKADNIMMQLGICYVDKTQKLDRISCDLSRSQVAAAPITQARNGAVAAFEKVPQSSAYFKEVQKRLDFLKAEQTAVYRRCSDQGHNIERELCYVKIKRAYDAEIFAGGFQLDDKSCEKYVADYDREFRRQ